METTDAEMVVSIIRTDTAGVERGSCRYFLEMGYELAEEMGKYAYWWDGSC